MDTLQELIERELVLFGYYELAIEHALLSPYGCNGGCDVGEVPRERLAGFGAKVDCATVPKCETPESIPFWFVLPVPTRGECIDQTSFHGRVAAGHWQRMPIARGTRLGFHAQRDTARETKAELGSPGRMRTQSAECAMTCPAPSGLRTGPTRSRLHLVSPGCRIRRIRQIHPGPVLESRHRPGPVSESHHRRRPGFLARRRPLPRGRRSRPFRGASRRRHRRHCRLDRRHLDHRQASRPVHRS